ncbi:hypothetical protein CHS0354_015493 [Potamilus streckersoni]|uniref:Selenoprotein S n=1 Tax=Potamilus streckersoni TaxID=2493646 RepID=A0AAE0RY29_9BIVA|nr:hypothetical protein CHS0354_015493 [Potamilus streckersoni]
MEEQERPETTPPTNQDPVFLSAALQNVTEFLQAYGWFIILGIVVILYIKSKLSPSIQKLQDKFEQRKESRNYDPNKALKMSEELDAARRRMQEQLNAQAARYAEQQKIKEEEKRQQKIQEWDNFQDGKGYRSKYKPQEEVGASAGTKVKSTKPRLRQTDFNPLMGENRGGSSYRPPRRGGGGG